MFENKTKVLLSLPRDVLDRARVMAGEATSALKLPVSVQIVVRALLEEGLKRDGDRKLFANIEEQARTVRRVRSLAGRGRALTADKTAPVEASIRAGVRERGRASPRTSIVR